MIRKEFFPMSKKTLKILVCLAGIAAIVAGVIYFFVSKKHNSDTCEEEENEVNAEEDHLDAMDALDLSSLTFSRHYVDLR